MSAFPPIQFDPISVEQIRDYAEASEDFNKIHLDENFARSAGLPGVIAHGMLSMGLVGEAIFRWGIPLEKIQKFESKFKEKVLPGDILKALVTAEKAGQIEIRLANQRDEDVLTASLEIAT